MAYIEAERFAELKARVKAECLRRCHTGSVAEYGGEKYEYTNSPTEDHTVDVEHYEKLALPLSKIHSEKVPSLDGRRIVFDEDITEFEAALTLFETRPMTDKTRGDCETSCTGACYTGCSGDCTGGCETTCSGECQGSCTGCGSGCANTCEGSCSGGCYGCGGNCTGGCSGSCDGSCSGCSGSCSGGCSSSCSGGCKSSCTVTCGRTPQGVAFVLPAARLRARRPAAIAAQTAQPYRSKEVALWKLQVNTKLLRRTLQSLYRRTRFPSSSEVSCERQSAAASTNSSTRST